MTASKPLPPIDPWTRPYWAAAREHKLLLQYCPACQKHVFYPRRYCPTCASDQLEWVESPGIGKVYSFTVVQNNAPSAFVDDMPFIIAVVKLAEGVQMMTNIVGCDPNEVTCEMAVKVVFEELTEEISLPKFKPL
jgi:uncharacterized OB-fold protein